MHATPQWCQKSPSNIASVTCVYADRLEAEDERRAPRSRLRWLKLETGEKAPPEKSSDHHLQLRKAVETKAAWLVQFYSDSVDTES